MLTENYPNIAPRQESDREQIATIIQRGHINHDTSHEIAGAVLHYINKTLRPDKRLHNIFYIETP